MKIPRISLSQSLRSNRRFQLHPILLLAGKRHPQLEKLHNDIPKFLKEHLIIRRIPLHMLLEPRILHQRHIRRQHHQRLRLHILILLWPVPLLEGPFLAEQKSEVVVRHDGGGEAPGSVEAGAVSVAAAEGVGAGEGDDFSVVEAHAAEDGA